MKKPSYKLCKALKEAGYPQELKNATIIPSLEEVLDELGKEFETLSWYQYPDIWLATGGEGGDIKEFKGKSALEATIKLYIAIKGK